MSRLWIKICGMTSRDAIAAAADAGADAVGFVFYEASPRHLTIERALELQDYAPRALERVAVFLHPSLGLVHDVIGKMRPDWVQTDLEDLATLDLPATQRTLPVIRSGVSSPVSAELPARVLLESARSGRGERADWNEARFWSERCEVVLAGGLDAANVAAAVEAVRPFGVDVSSGVESTRGVKDPKLVHEFVKAARAAASAVRSKAGTGGAVA
jgi:phosphoribosylanthranilate isomerase